MTVTAPPRPSGDAPSLDSLPQVFRPLPRWVPYALAVASLAVALGLRAVLGGGPIAVAMMLAVVFVGLINVVSRRVEGSRRAADRTVTAVVTAMFLATLVPLVSVMYTVVGRGVGRFDVGFFTETMRSVVGEGGGAQHAIVGTLIITSLATLISVPIGVLTAIYLVEYGRGRVSRAVTFLVDVMTGIPSIVAGLFAYALFVIVVGPGVRFGIGGAVALSVLMTPVVVRASEEMLKLVPAELREASYALGVPKWRTILKVVLPVAAAGIGTGITLAIARVIGETAPLLLIAGTTKALNTDPFNGRMETLPVFTFYSVTQPGTKAEFSIDRGWSAALVLMLVVLLLNVVARVIARAFAPKGSR